jgi:hypothetical protein
MTREQFGQWLAGMLYTELNVLKDTNALADRVLEAARSVPTSPSPPPVIPEPFRPWDSPVSFGSTAITP